MTNAKGLLLAQSTAIATAIVMAISVVVMPSRAIADPLLDWVIDVDPAGPGEPLPTALLGHYDLSGALLGYDQQPGLVAAMRSVGFSDWRVGVGRWEASTQLLPTLSDASPCPIFLPESAAPPGASDLDLIAARDWFVDDGQSVDLSDTEDDSRYALAYFRSVLDEVDGFGATPFVSIDSMPRALAVNRSPLRADCQWSFQNQVSNVRPASAPVFAAAVAGLVERTVEGSDGSPARAVRHWEIWNEPEFPQFWDPAFEDRPGPFDRYFEMAIDVLVALDAYRASSSHPNALDLSFGLGGFGRAEVAAATLAGFDSAPLPAGFVPLDFVSFHAYADDPLLVVSAIETVAGAAASSNHYTDVELVLSEWGPNLMNSAGDPIYAASMQPALHVSTVLALGAAAGLDRAHRAIFWDFFPSSIRLGLLDHEMNPRPAYRAYELLSRVIVEGATRITPAGLADGRLDGGDAAVLASVDGQGTTRVLLVNRGLNARTVEVLLGGSSRTPTRVLRYDDPAQPIVETAGIASEVVVPAESLLLLEFDPVAVPALGLMGQIAVCGMLVGFGWVGSRKTSRVGGR